NAKMRSAIKQALTNDLHEVEEILPQHYLEEYKIPSRREAIHHLHIPESKAHLKHARRRFVYEELLLFQLKMQLLRFRHREQMSGNVQHIHQEKTKIFINDLPYMLTDAQNKALQEIMKDMTSPVQMNRLLQGDVGSGKTAVALIA